MNTYKILDFCEVISGATPKTSKKEFWGDEILWATPSDLSAIKSMYISDTHRKITKLGLASCSAKLLPAGSILFSSRAPIGLLAINTVPMATNQGFKSFLVNNEICDTHYLYHWLKKNRRLIDAMGVGATFKEVSKGIVGGISVKLPDLDEQKKVAKVLNKAEQMMRLHEEGMEAAIDMQTVLMNEMIA